jgi:hypothetical protein
MQYDITARRLDASGSHATAHGAEVRLATDILKYGTISNTLAGAVLMTGTIRRA